jgi:hypothetical protein
MTFIPELKWKSLTGAINEMKSPNQFLRRFLYTNNQTLPTEDIELGFFEKGREIAPFVRKNGEGVMVGGHTQRYATVAAPNIRIKRPFTPSELLFGRQPGTPIFSPGGGAQVSAVRQHIARDLQVMADMITNAEEYLVAMSLQGTISYEVADGEVFTITYPRAASNNITLSTFWDNTTEGTYDATNAQVFEDIHTVKQVMSDEVGLAPTDAICGSEAASLLRQAAQNGDLAALNNNFNVTAGDMDLTQQFRDDGVIYLGNLGGIRFWEYGRTAELNGVAKNMIRPKYVEFVSSSPASERVMYYGAIPDLNVFQGRAVQTRRYAKSWTENDPPVMMALTHTRPLPVPRRVNATVSMKVSQG